MRYCCLLVFLFLPYVSFASVQIAEIAWMGSIDSPNHEWIELHNTGSGVSLDGWILHDANNLTIELSGTVAASARIVLERTSDASAAGSAFLLYTGALNNSGATLVLRNAEGVVVDQVDGGDGWENIGGNNETKETAQLRNVEWITAAATPGDVPGIAVVTDDSSSESVSQTQGTTGSVSAASNNNSEPLQLVLPDITLQLEIDAPTNVHVAQPFRLSVEPSGVGQTIAGSLVYEWNFGNGENLSGKEVEHSFTHPGQYVVVVSGEYKRQKQFARQTINVLPVELKLTRSVDDSSHILHNLSNKEIDVGGYRLVGTTEHIFSKHTILLPQAEVVVPINVTNISRAPVVLYDQSGKEAAMYIPGVIPTVAVQPLALGRVAQAVITPNKPSATPVSNFGFVTETPVASPQIATSPQLIPVAMAAQENATLEPSSEHDWPLYGLILLLLLGTAGIYLVPQKKDNPPWV